MMRARWLYAFLLMAALSRPAQAQSDRTTLRFDSLTFVAFGGSMRQRYERVTNSDWGRAARDSDGYVLDRYMAHADVHVPGARFFTELSSVQARGRVGGPRPTDADALDLHQGFGELTLGSTPRLQLRAGRQEMGLGSERLVSFRDFPNVRRSFDGVRATATTRRWTFDVFQLMPVVIQRGKLDNRGDRAQRFWGLHATRASAVRRHGVDVYYLGIRNDRTRYDQGTAREIRHSAGTRIWGITGEWDYDVELVDQWGSFGEGTITAWTVASHVGYTFQTLPATPRLGLKADVTSGDADRGDVDLETFNPLFPRGGYFGVASLIGPQNHADLHPALDLRLSQHVTFSTDWDFFWRTSLEDGQYTVWGALQVPSSGSDERYVGNQLSGTLSVRLNRHVGFIFNYGHFRTGPFIRQTTGARSLDYFTGWLDLRG